MPERKKFNWSHEDGNGSTKADGVGRTALAVIDDYINKNRNKSAEQLQKDLDILGNRKIGEWDEKGNHPFSLEGYADVGGGHYFKESITLDSGEKIFISAEWGARNNSLDKWDKLKIKMTGYGYTIEEVGEKSDGGGKNIRTSLNQGDTIWQEVLLQQFNQIILYGPPGTGKTYHAKTVILPQLLGIGKDDVDDEQSERWDIVQFHPSYNYEDFVRGVKAVTTEGNVAYKTVDRIFGDICKRAEKNSDKNYVLIIDEINRANVSAVLGELIYALEYRGEPIKTPYAIEGDSTLMIPENLYIIGTMNTADRTIGQIDYAVRRRFAFVPCFPNKNIITDGKARDIFSLVDEIFSDELGYLSSDYEADDVRIGHSYFMPKEQEGFAPGELARKIFYQVVPILREYVKDGVLLKEAEDKISEIEENVRKDVTMVSDSGSGSKKRVARKKRGMDYFYYSEKEGVFIDGLSADKENDRTLRRCRAISIEDIQERCNWDSCAELGFVLTSGVSNLEEIAEAKERIDRIRQGDILIAMLLRDSQEQGGVIGWGEVTGKGEPINKFGVNGTPILDCSLKEGKTYREKYPLAAADADDREKCDWMIPVKWIKILSRAEAEGPSQLPRIVSRLSQKKLRIVNAKFGRRK